MPSSTLKLPETTRQEYGLEKAQLSCLNKQQQEQQRQQRQQRQQQQQQHQFKSRVLKGSLVSIEIFAT